MHYNPMERCKVYSDSKTSIKKLLEKDCNVEDSVISNHLILIKRDVSSSKDDSVKEAALDMLNFLMDNVASTTLESEVIKLVNDKSLSVDIKKTIMSYMRNTIVKSISNETFNITEYLGMWKNQNVLKLIDIIEELFQKDLEKSKCQSIYLRNIIPEVMDPNTNNEIRDVLLDIAFRLLPYVDSSELPVSEYQKFVSNVIAKYVKTIGDLREKDYENWHRMWIFVVNFCGKNMHSSMDLTNRLLRVVEYAFRNASCHQRLKGYDCWKELIKNASLKHEYLCSNKQIKLLMTPLKAKFSKQEQVIMKRFEVFVFLIEKLQDKATLCLNEFLEFCFGAVTPNSDPAKTGQGKSVQGLWEKIVGILLRLLGNTDHCVGDSSVTVAVLNASNINTHCQVIVNCLEECAVLMKDDVFEGKREKIYGDLWTTFLNVVNGASSESREACQDIIVQTILKFIKDDNSFCVKTICSVIFSKDSTIHKHIFGRISRDLLLLIFQESYSSISYDQKIFQNMVAQCLVSQKLFDDLITNFDQVKPAEDINLPLACDCWLGFSNYILLAVNNDVKDKLLKFLLWPVQYFSHFKDLQLKDVSNSWIKTYQLIVDNTETNKINVLRELEKIFKQNPLKSPNIVKTLTLITIYEEVFSKDFASKLLEITALCLALPTLKQPDQERLISIVSLFLNSSLTFYTEDNNEDAITKFCQCLEHIFKIHKNYDLLEDLINLLGSLPAILKTQFSNLLSKLLFDMYSAQDDLNDTVAKQLQKIMLILEVDKPDVVKATKFSTPNGNRSNKIITPPSGRSAKIANLLKGNSKSSPATSPNVLRLFGKNLDNTTPVKIKGSQLNNTPLKTKKLGQAAANNSPKQKKPPPSIDDESTSQFVTINTEIKIQPDKLNEHQKEIMAKRREDIPALYQDLSQSHSQDIFNIKNSNSSVITDVGKENMANKLNGPELNFESVKQSINIEGEIKLPPPPTPLTTTNSDSKHEESSEAQDTTEEESHPTIIEAQPADLKNDSADNKSDKTKHLESVDKKEKRKIEDTKRNKIEAELRRLKMDIVASEDFLNVPRRSRSKTTDPKAKKSTAKTNKKASPPRVRRKSLDNTREEKVDKKRRMTIGIVKEIKDHTEKEAKPKKENKIKDAIEAMVSKGRGRKKKVPEIEPNKIVDESEDKGGKPDVQANKTDAGSEDKREKSKVQPSKIVDESEDKGGKSDVQANKIVAGNEDKREKSKVQPNKIVDDNEDKAEKLDVLQNKIVDEVGDKEENSVQPRKRKLSESDTEDIIESSQETSVCITPICSPKRRPSSSTNSTVAPEPTENLNVTVDEPAKNPDVSLAETVTQTDTETCDSNMAELDNQVLKLDLPQKPELTDSEIVISHMDTVSLLDDETDENNVTVEHVTAESDFERESTVYVKDFEMTVITNDEVTEVLEITQPVATTPIIKRRSLPTSPISNDTPTKTNELLDNTVNISPIKEEQAIKVRQTGKISSSSSSSDEDDASAQKITEKPINGFTEKAKLWNVENVQSAVTTHRLTIYKKKSGGLNMSPSGSRIRKLMSPFHQKKANLQEEFASADDDKDDVLTFTRELPSPVAAPRNSILKKRLSDIDDGLSPCSKRKRVHFSYPTTTCKKVFFKPISSLRDAKISLIHQEETGEEIDFLDYCHEQLSNESNVAYIYPKLTECSHPVRNLFVDDLEQNMDLQQKLKPFNIKTVGDLAKKTEEDLLALPLKSPVVTNVFKALDSYHKRQFKLEEGVDDYRLEFEVDEDEGVNSIYPELIGCSDTVVRLLRKMKNLDLEIWLYKLREHNIKHISDLVRCNEVELVKLPFRKPVVPNVYRALDFYYKNRVLSTKSVEVCGADVQIEFDDGEIVPQCFYPKLLDCQDTVDCILKKNDLTETWSQKLLEHNIKTIGDLASLPEKHILALPIKEPVVSSVYTSLENYYKKKNLDNTVQFNKNEDPQIILEKFVTEAEVPLNALASVLFKYASAKDVSSMLHQNNFDLRDIVNDEDFKSIIHHYTKKKDVRTVLQYVFESAESSKMETVYFDEVMEQCVNNKPLMDILQKRPLEDVRVYLEDAIDKKMFTKNDVLDTCLIPLVDDICDVHSYLNNLNVVQLGDVVVKYIRSQDLDQFIKRLNDSYEEQILSVVSCTKVLKECTERELTGELTKRSSEDVLKSHITLVNNLSGSNQNEVLIDMFRTIGSKLPRSTLMKLHIEFLSSFNLDE